MFSVTRSVSTHGFPEFHLLRNGGGENPRNTSDTSGNFRFSRQTSQHSRNGFLQWCFGKFRDAQNFQEQLIYRLICQSFIANLFFR